MAKQEVEKLLSQTEHHLTLDDFALLQELNDAAERVTNPKGETSDFPSLPVRLGKYLIAAPTISISQWYNDCAIEWWGQTGLADLALGFALQVHITGPWLWEQDRKTLERAVKKFARGLNCTPEEYERILKTVLPMSDSEEQGGDSEGYGPLIALLCKEYSSTPDYWVHEANIETIQTLVESYMEGLEAEFRQVQKASKQSSLPPFKTPKMAALETFRSKSNLVREAWDQRN